MARDDERVGLDGLRVEFDDERVVSDAGVMLVGSVAERLRQAHDGGAGHEPGAHDRRNPHVSFIFQPEQQFSELVGELKPGETFFVKRPYILIPNAGRWGSPRLAQHRRVRVSRPAAAARAGCWRDRRRQSLG
jgi:hypothetical protein